MKKTLLFIAWLSIVTLAHAQTEEAFKPSGSPNAKVFFNFHTDLEAEKPAFEVQRAYFGYNYSMSENFSGKVLFDIGKAEVDINDSTTVPTSLRYTTFLKNAALSFKKGAFKLDAGVIGLQQVKIQESHWGHRYVYKSHMDWTGMGATADLGILANYKFSDMFSADLTIRNGEGYKKIQKDDKFRTALGLTLIPIEGLTIRGFYDYLPGTEAMYTIAHFVGYSVEKFTAGVEYNMQLNAKNTADQTLSGYSAYASYDITNSFQLFARYDDLSSNTLEGATDPWNLEESGNLFIAGVQYTPIKNVLVSLDFQGFMPKDDAEASQNMIYLHSQFSF